MIRIIKSEDSGALLRRRAARMEAAEAVVRPILEAVRRRGDKALMEYARKFDGFARRRVRVSEEELAAARRRLNPEFRRALRTAAANIRDYARRQMPRPWMRQAGGVRLGQVVRPLGAIAAYVPAGRYPAAIDDSDDGGAGAGGGRRQHLRGVAKTGGRGLGDCGGAGLDAGI